MVAQAAELQAAGPILWPRVLIQAPRSSVIVPHSQEKYFILSLSACDTAASVQGCADLFRTQQSTDQRVFFSPYQPSQEVSEASRIFKGSLPVALKPQMWLFPSP